MNIKIFKINESNKMTPVILFADCNNELLKQIKESTSKSILLVYFTEVDWACDFSPWSFENFKGNGFKTLSKALETIKDMDKLNDDLTIIGYSLGGLLALVSAMDDRVKNVGSVSGSLWYPELIERIKDKIINKNIYLSLGDKESKTKNMLMSTVDDKTKDVYELLKDNNKVFFEYNIGNHFTDCQLRILKAFNYLL